MMYAIIIWSILAITTFWVIYQLIHVKHVSLVDSHINTSVVDQLMIRYQARLLFILVGLWMLVYMFINSSHIGQSTMKMDLVLSVIVVAILTPLLTYFIHYGQKHMSIDAETHHHSSIQMAWTLNVITALLYASLINYSIQMFILL